MTIRRASHVGKALTVAALLAALRGGCSAPSPSATRPAALPPNTVAYQPSDGCLFLTGTADAQLPRICGLPDG
jgi:hypothetical protein